MVSVQAAALARRTGAVARYAIFAELVDQARSQGAERHAEIAVWLNDRGHRTATGRHWNTSNVKMCIHRLRGRGSSG
jgi:hypothetical protein